MLDDTPRTEFGPDAYALADWRRRINDLYAEVRAMNDPKAAWMHWHHVRSELFRDHPMSPLSESSRKDFDKIDVFPHDPDLRFAVDLQPVDANSLAFNLGRDGSMSARPIATTDGLRTALNAELTVYWIEGYGGGLFIPFKDALSGSETYGGGRYLVDAIKGSDLGLDDEGRLILDFNFAYNPSCSLNPEYICPLAPEENRLPVAVRAGECTP